MGCSIKQFNTDQCSLNSFIMYAIIHVVEELTKPGMILSNAQQQVKKTPFCMQIAAVPLSPFNET